MMPSGGKALEDWGERKSRNASRYLMQSLLFDVKKQVRFYTHVGRSGSTWTCSRLTGHVPYPTAGGRRKGLRFYHLPNEAEGLARSKVKVQNLNPGSNPSVPLSFKRLPSKT